MLYLKSADLLGISKFVAAKKRFLVYLNRADIHELEKLCWGGYYADSGIEGRGHKCPIGSKATGGRVATRY